MRFEVVKMVNLNNTAASSKVLSTPKNQLPNQETAADCSFKALQTFYKTIKGTIVSFKGYIIFSGMKPSYIYTFRLSISLHQAVYEKREM
jgi:hypothetical protein